MCINESVLSLKNSTMINEKCLEMQKKKSKKKSEDLEPPAKKKRTVNSTSGCPYYKSGAIQSLRDQSLLQVQDIEQLVEKGAILLNNHTTQCGKDRNLLSLGKIRKINLQFISKKVEFTEFFFNNSVISTLHSVENREIISQ